MSSPKMKVLKKDTPPMTNSIQMLEFAIEGDGENITKRLSISLAKKL